MMRQAWSRRYASHASSGRCRRKGSTRRHVDLLRHDDTIKYAFDPINPPLFLRLVLCARRQYWVLAAPKLRQRS
jgi:hypothetical protein